MPTAAFMAMGCKVSQFETESMEGLFKKRGYEIVPFDSVADVYVINTCAVTKSGEAKSRKEIHRARRRNPDAVIAVTGCYAQVASDEIKSIDGVNVVLGTQDRGRIVDEVERAAGRTGVVDGVQDIMEAREFEDIPLYDTPKRTRAFLKIQEGCDNYCSYCIIPYARGHQRSRHPESVRREAEKLAGMGFCEIVLTGIHLGTYGRDLAGDITLADAAREVLAIPGIKRLRLGSLESIELSPELFTLIRGNDRFAKHLHLPLQAGSDEILHRMNRHYDTGEFARLLEHVWHEVPGVAISTDVIVGFPGETEELFEESLDFVESMGFTRVHVFPFSSRPGTPAASMPGQVPEPVKKERVHRMKEVALRKAEAFHASFNGWTMDVLFEARNKDGIADGLTGNYIRVYTDEPVKLGEIQGIKLVKTYRDGMWGRIE